jgi:hypothetical protein
MSTPPPPLNPYDSPENFRPGMSTGTKVLLGLGIGCGVLVLLCCGGMMVGGYFFGRSMQEAISEDPQQVAAVAKSIVDLEVPEPLAPVVSMDFKMPFVDQKIMTMAMFGHKRDAGAKQDEPDSILVLFQMTENIGGNRKAMKAQFEAQMQQSGRKDWEEAPLESEEIIEHEVNGSPAQFTFGKGKRNRDGREVWQASGAFDGKGGPAMIFMQLDAENFTEEQARGVIDSMQ